MFNAMMDGIKEESVGFLFNLEVQVDQPVEAAPSVEPVHVSQMLGAMSGAGAAPARPPRRCSDGRECRYAVASQADPPRLRGRARRCAVRVGRDGGPQGRRVGCRCGPSRAPTHLHYTAPSETGGVDERDEGGPASGVRPHATSSWPNTPKNAPCPCGSGKKFKMCHGRR